MNWFEHYANAGMSVLPIKTDGSKAPAVNSWGRYQLELASESELQAWHEAGHGVALIGGRISGGLEIVDIDDPALARPFFYALLEADERLVHKVAFVATPRRDQETGKTGVHVLYRCSKPEGNQKLAMSEPLPQFTEEGNPVVSSVTGDPICKPETLIETRGEGGYVLTVGCPAECHPSGNTYEHKYGCEIADLQELTDEQRRVLLRVAATFDRGVSVEYEQSEHEHSGNTPGNEFAAATSWEEILEPHGWKQTGNAQGIQRWCRPGKSKGVSATTGIVSSHGAELLCVFSSNAHPFDGPSSGHQCSTHSKFDAYTRLNFGGDHRAAAGHLASEGFGQEVKSKPKPIVFETADRSVRRQLLALHEGGEQTLTTGLDSLDDMTGGFAFGELVIIGGRPSHGKTMLGLQMGETFAGIGERPLLFSEEMSTPMLAKRWLHRASDIPESEWHLNVDSLANDYRAHAKGLSDIFIAPKCGTIEKTIETIDHAAEDHDLRIVVVDYAQLLRGKGNSRYEQVTDVSQQLREATSRHNLLMLMLCQLNREGGRGNRPHSMDLRDSGQLEQDADVILLVDWPARRGENSHDPCDWFVYCEKNRNRAIGANSVRLKVNPLRQRIEEPSNAWRPDKAYDDITGGDY